MGHAGYSLAPTSVGYGLERFGALSHLDMQSLGGKTWPWNEGLESQLTRLALRPAAVAKLAALSDTLQTLRLAYYEDVPYRMVRLYRVGLTGLLLYSAPSL